MVSSDISGFTTIRNYTTLKLVPSRLVPVSRFTTIRNYTTLKHKDS